LSGDLDDLDTMLMELDSRSGADSAPAAEARGQLELFGSLLTSFAEQKTESEHQHLVVSDGAEYDGSWEEIVRRLRDQTGNPAESMQEYMNGVSQHGFRKTGIRIPTHDAESFLRGSAVAGLLRIVR
jgi:hypothetical protein